MERIEHPWANLGRGSIPGPNEPCSHPQTACFSMEIHASTRLRDIHPVWNALNHPRSNFGRGSLRATNEPCSHPQTACFSMEIHAATCPRDTRNIQNPPTMHPIGSAMSIHPRRNAGNHTRTNLGRESVHRSQRNVLTSSNSALACGTSCYSVSRVFRISKFSN